MTNPAIDTVRVVAPIPHQDLANRLRAQPQSDSRRQEIADALISRHRRIRVPGAFGAVATVQSIEDHSQLVIEASLPRFFTGQNVFGSADLLPQVIKLVQAVCKYLGIKSTKEVKQAIARGELQLSRIDLVAHMQLESDSHVEHFLKAMKLQLAFSAPQFSAYRNDTLYVSQHSDTKTLKFYNKGRELQAHQLHPELPRRKLIEGRCQGMLRVELVLRRRHLKGQGINLVRDWDTAAGRQVLTTAVTDLALSNGRLMRYVPHPQLLNLANALLAAHMHGLDVETIVPSTRALAVHARQILEVTGINLFVPFPAQVAAAKTDLESLAQNLVFGPSRRAAELGITAGLPMLEIEHTASSGNGSSTEKHAPSDDHGNPNRTRPTRPRAKPPVISRAQRAEFRRSQAESLAMSRALFG